MDHYGLLNVTRTLAISFSEVVKERDTSTFWNWGVTPVLFPESKCPYCFTVIRSPYIWLLKNPPRLNLLVGVILPEEGKQIKVQSNIHPHSMGGETFCIGSHPNGAALLATGPNLRDIPLGRGKTALWVNKYWGPHWCKPMEDIIISYDSEQGVKYIERLIKP